MGLSEHLKQRTNGRAIRYDCSESTNFIWGASIQTVMEQRFDSIESYVQFNYFKMNFSIWKWISAAIRVLVDGGANHWFEFVAKNQLDDSIENPNFLTGDMDSITNESTERLKTMNCQRVQTPDQMETDCTKSIMAITSYLEPQKVNIINI